MAATQESSPHLIWVSPTHPEATFYNIDFEKLFSEGDLMQAIAALPEGEVRFKYHKEWYVFSAFNPTYCQKDPRPLPMPDWPPGLVRVPIYRIGQNVGALQSSHHRQSGQTSGTRSELVVPSQPPAKRKRSPMVSDDVTTEGGFHLEPGSGICRWIVMHGHCCRSSLGQGCTRYHTWSDEVKGAVWTKMIQQTDDKDAEWEQVCEKLKSIMDKSVEGQQKASEQGSQEESNVAKT